MIFTPFDTAWAEYVKKRETGYIQFMLTDHQAHLYTWYLSSQTPD